MTPEQFCYWLQGFFEIREADIAPKIALTLDQVQCIKNHLNLVFKKETPVTTFSPPIEMHYDSIPLCDNGDPQGPVSC